MTGEAIQGAFWPEAREPPADLAIEAALLGACMVDGRSYDRAARLTAEAFADPAHGRIWATIAALRGEGRAATPQALRRLFLDDDTLRDVGGARYIAELAAGAALSVDVEDYARILEDLQIRRAALDLFAEGMRGARRDLEGDAVDVLDAAQARISEIGRIGRLAETTQGVGSLVDGVLDDLDAIENGGGPIGVPSGLRCLDDAIGRMLGGELWIIGARPAMGKSALALTMAMTIAKQSGPTMFVSLEMSRRQIGQRVISAHSGVSAFAIRNGRLSPTDRDLVERGALAAGELALDVYVDRDTSIEAVVAAARRQHRARPLAALFVDYLQLMRSGDRFENRVQELTRISAALKSLALDLDIPVIALSQLNRGLEQREDKRPNIADLRESGAIEQDADGVLMLHREEVYHMRKRPAWRDDPAAQETWEQEHAQLKGRAEIIVAKHRSGEAGKVVRCAFVGTSSLFTDPPPDWAGEHY